jgi:hypothetical protein
LDCGTTVPLSDTPLEIVDVALALQNLSAFRVPIKPNQTRLKWNLSAVNRAKYRSIPVKKIKTSSTLEKKWSPPPCH